MDRQSARLHRGPTPMAARRWTRPSSFERDVRFACEKEEGCSPMPGTAPLLLVETLIFVIIGFHRFPK